MVKLLAGARDKGSQSLFTFGDDFTIYLVDDTPITILEVFASPNADS
jgi:hypothetical protein